MNLFKEITRPYRILDTLFKRKFLERTSSKTYLTLSEAQKNAKKIDWNNFEIKKPR